MTSDECPNCRGNGWIMVQHGPNGDIDSEECSCGGRVPELRVFRRLTEAEAEVMKTSFGRVPF